MVVIFVISSVRGDAINEIGLGRESYHVNGHFILFVLLCAAYYKAVNRVLPPVLLTIIYGVFDELHQRFTPGRSSSFYDIFVDSMGAVLMGLVLWKLQPHLPKKLKNWLNN